MTGRAVGRSVAPSDGRTHSSGGCSCAGCVTPRRGGWTDRLSMALEPEGSNRLLHDVLATPGNDTCADCANPGKGSPKAAGGK